MSWQKERKEMDYRRYALSAREWIWSICVSGVLAGGIAWLFYRSVWGLVVFPGVLALYVRGYRKERQEKRRERLLSEFKDGMQAVSAALLAGYSMENAWREAEKELRELHGEQSLMHAEFRQINAAVQLNQPLEKVLAAFAARSGCEDIESFADVFVFAKRSGGDFAKIIRTTVSKLTGRMEVKREIQTVLAGKRLEGKVMNAMPMLILAYLTVTSGDFLAVLYGNVTGGLIMSAALAAYAGTLGISSRILEIQV